jgi:hypothetical protein
MNEDAVKGTMKTSTAVSYKNVSAPAGVAKYYVYDADTNAVLYCFVAAKNAAVETELYAVLLDTTPVYDVNDDDVAVNYYAVAINGEETELVAKVADDKLAKLSAGDVFTYELTDGFVSAASAVTSKTVAAVYDDYVVMTDSSVLYYNDEAMWTITMEYEVDGVTLDSVTVDEDASYEKDLKVFYTVETGTKKLTNAWVVEEVK